MTTKKKVPLSALKRAGAADIEVLQLWMNGGCNARCIMCEIWREKPGRNIAAWEFEAWMPEWKAMGIRAVELCGEPLIHPEVEKICDILGKADIAMEFLSNGLTLFSRSALVARHASTLTVSLDGPRDVHNKIRNIPRAFDKLSAGISAVRKLNPALPIFGRCAVHKENYLHLSDVVTAAKDIGLTSISFLALDVTTPAFGRDRLADGVISAEKLFLSAQDLLSLSKEIDALEKTFPSDFAEGFICESPAMLRTFLLNQSANDTKPEEVKAPIHCDAPWTAAVIEPDGDVRPCFFLPAYGNIRQAGSLSQLLKDPKTVTFLKELDIANNAICQKCVCPRDIRGDSDGRITLQPASPSL